MTTKRILLAVTGILSASVLVLVGVAGVDNTAQAQGASLQPSNVQVVNGPNAGEAVVSWNAVAGAAYYRIGWVSVPNFQAVTGAGRDWREAFYFVDLKNAGQTSFTVSRLEPGAAHLFLVGGNSTLYGQPQWSDLESLTLNSDTTACPTPTPTPGATATPTPGATITATPPPTATGGDYDADNDGLIEIRSIAQLDAMRYDLDGDGVDDPVSPYANGTAAYAAAFPGAATSMGCPDAGCTGYELAANLDFGTEVSATGWLPIGYWNSEDDNAGFTATFDGGGYAISNLHIARNNTDSVGLFGYNDDGDIRQAKLENVNIAGKDSVGALVGRNEGAVSDSYATGIVSGAVGTGGLVGYVPGGDSITRSYASVVVSSSGNTAGGLVGSSAGVIRESYASGDVSGDDYTGGLAGWSSGTISDSYATGDVSGNDHTGGLTGWNGREGSEITRSHATGNVSGRLDVGGLVGGNYTNITASYASGDASGRGYTGGLVGNNEGAITASYATGSASSDSWDGSWLGIGEKPGDVGGLVGRNQGSITASYATGSVYSEDGWCRYVTSGGYCWADDYVHDSAGGLVGQNDGVISASYATGAVIYGEKTILGGLVGSGEGTVGVSYWNTETSELIGSSAGVGKTTAELQSPTANTGIYASWNPNWWDFGTSSQYPVLKVAGLSVAVQRGQATATQPGSGTTADRAALVAFYEATGGNNSQWLMTDGWISDAPLGRWYGVTTNDDGRVTELELDANGLSREWRVFVDPLQGGATISREEG